MAVITGTELADTLNGTPDDDTIDGLGGDDILIGGAGNNVLFGGSGLDAADYSGAAGPVRVKLNGNRAEDNGFGGIDTFDSIENLLGSAFNDILIGNALRNRIEGGPGSDYLIGLDGDDVLVGGEGAPNHLQGGTGDDTYIVSLAGDTITEFAGEGSDTVETGLSSYRLRDHLENLFYTGVGAFTGIGNALDNRIQGSDGDDWLIGAGGNNDLIGGNGRDTAYYRDAAGSVIVRLNSGVAESNGEGGVDSLSEIENATGSAFADTLIGDAGNNRLDGYTGSDTLIGLAGNDVLIGGSGDPNQLQGGTGDDNYVVSTLGDTLVEFADEGKDTVHTTLSSFTLGSAFETLSYGGVGNFNGTGNDLSNAIFGGSGNDRLDGGAGYDSLVGYDGDDVLIGGSGNPNQLQGGRGDDTYVVSAHDTIIEHAGEGTDTIRSDISYWYTMHVIPPNFENYVHTGSERTAVQGNRENNEIYGGPGGDDLAGDIGIGQSADILHGLGGDDFLDGMNGTDILYGGAGDDQFFNSGPPSDNDQMFGEAGNDRFRGQAGDQRITGGPGADWIWAEEGADTIVYVAAEDAGDVIVDFFRSQGDKIDLSALLDSIGMGGVDPFAAGVITYGQVALGNDVYRYRIMLDVDGSTGPAAPVVLAEIHSWEGYSYENPNWSGELIQSDFII